MTRINVVPVTELCDQHLLAEHREITRIPNMLISGKLKFHYDDRPGDYTLGAGHVKFFTDKLTFLLERYILLQKECELRRFNVSWKFPSDGELLFASSSNTEFWKNYFPSERALRINRERIQVRMPSNARFTPHRF